MIARASQIAQQPEPRRIRRCSVLSKQVWIGMSAGLLILFSWVVGRAQDSTAEEAAVGILEAKCALCHGSSKMSGLDVRQREGLLKGGARGPAIMPGKAEESLVYQAAAHQGELKMPPGSSAPLPHKELEVLKKWINDGASWPLSRTPGQKTSEPSWWSLKKLRRPQVPQVDSPTPDANPIDSLEKSTSPRIPGSIAPLL
jgi:Planctomycete cytochrome C